MPEDQAPPVVAVVVASDPGPWLEDCLAALGAQDYANLSILVIDAGSREPIAARIAAVAPDVYLRRLADNRGFGPSANVVLDTVEGSTFYLFCHDDIVPDDDAVRKMVEEAFRSNAGIVAPKLVAYDEADRLLQLGLGVDRFGAPVRRVGRRELDQSQHDEAREVFGAPGGCTLVRSDLFAALHGFDPKISMFGEDVDLSWRARVAGARVVVAPSARVRHCEATASRQRPLPEARALQWRHELRAVLKNYGRARRMLVVAQLAVLSLLEICYFGIIGKRWRVHQVVGAWRWNLAPEQDLAGARGAVAASRRIPDRVVSRLFTRRSFRVTRFVRPMLEELVVHWSRPSQTFSSEGIPSSPPPRASELARPARRRMSRRTGLAVAATVVVLVFGSRSLLSGHLPLVGQYLPLPGPTALLGHYFGGWTDAGLQRAGPATPAFALLGLAGLVLFAGMGLVLKLALVLCVVLGAVGVARLLRPLGPPSARVAGAVAYLFLPLAWDDLARGDLKALAAYAAMPWVLARLARATGLEPFAIPGRATFALGRLGMDSLGLGILLCVAGSFEPIVVLLALACAIALLVATILFDRPAAGARAVIVACGAAAVAFVLAFPWSLTLVQPGALWSALSGAQVAPGHAPRLATLLGFALGPIGRGPLEWAFLAAASFVLLVGRGPRFAWGARLWLVALGAFALAWSGSQGWLGAGGGATRALVAPAAVCVAALVGLGASSVAADLRRSGFGWRHALAVAFGVASLAGLLPVLGSSVGGRWGLAETGYDSVLSWVAGAGPGAAAQRVLWLGDPRALPSPGWQVTPGLAAAVSSGGLPDGSRLWPSANPSAGNAILSDVVSAESGTTIRLGRLLAGSGIRYIVVPSAVAPVLPGSQSAVPAPAPQMLLDGLAAQSDLHELPSEGGTVVFENSDWRSGGVVASAARGAGGTPAPLRAGGVALALLAWIGAAGLYVRRRRLRSRQERHGSHHRGHRAHAPQYGAGAANGVASASDGTGGGAMELDPAGAVH
jgi:GT2 family glycosyltransferase